MRRVGVLGGGQLARMLVEAAHGLGLRPSVLTEDRESSAAQVCRDVVVGSIGDSAALSSFVGAVDVVIFENEFVDCDVLARLPASEGSKFVPGLNVIRKLQDKTGQKQVLRQAGVPAARHVELPCGAEIAEWVQSALREFGGSCVLKWGRMGYDGKGVLPLRHHEFPSDPAILFCKEASERGIPVFAEERVDFRRELAMVAVCSVSHGRAVYPLVVTRQENRICSEVLGPANALGVAPKLEDEARHHVSVLADTVGIVGTFAVEFFETADGRLLVNEIAPRVHNSAHYTQDAAATSQFENHWRAVLGMPLGSTQTAPAFAMYNLLGPAGAVLSVEAAPRPAATGPVKAHWYGKAVRPDRKLGHLNGRVDSAVGLGKLCETLDGCRRSWVAETIRAAGGSTDEEA